MRNSFHWPLATLLLVITVVVLTVITVRERDKYLKTVEVLELELRTISWDSRTRFTRSILSNDEAIIFIGGVPRSGTTLMRAVLDSHPDIRCGEETSIVPAILGIREQWTTRFMRKTANLSGITQQTLDDATSAFLLEQMFKLWNFQLTKMLNLCSSARGLCLKVFYERLVQRPADEARRILNFLDVPWSDDVLRHQEKIGSEVKLNPNEFSTSQVKEKVNKKALTSW
ncbi:hypothetical protein RB195_009225 [Necator americanus]|uniref:Protein-tyrosine sulfotransferase n=1 Tax=Necator americanus TaxID=51031 RepID=A0ABR1CT65_NECAM